MSTCYLAPVIFLDIDGVLCTQSPWKPEVMAADGYSEFNAACVQHLNTLVAQTGAQVILTSSRRMTKSVAEFQAILQRRGCQGELLGKVDEATEPTGPPALLSWPAGCSVTASRRATSSSTTIRAWPSCPRCTAGIGCVPHTTAASTP